MKRRQVITGLIGFGASLTCPHCVLANSAAEAPESGTSPNTKNINFAHDYDDDIFIPESQRLTLKHLYQRLWRLQKQVGYGNFNITGFDEALSFGKRIADIGAFTQDEIALVEQLFFTDAKDYGFYGKKVAHELSQSVARSEVHKVKHTGHFLYKDAYEHYLRMRQDIGDSIVLTSGVRSNLKQLYLFVAKAQKVNGNLSRASRSVAPPGYSYHATGDFDVGRIDWGQKNFTRAFASTEEFQKLQKLDYVEVRYKERNLLGVRYEPWHIKLV